MTSEVVQCRPRKEGIHLHGVAVLLVAAFVPPEPPFTHDSEEVEEEKEERKCWSWAFLGVRVSRRAWVVDKRPDEREKEMIASKSNRVS